MKNFGIAKKIISNKITNEFINNGVLLESKNLSGKFLKILKESKILQLEFEVYNNLLNKTITNDSLATRYIDENINIFKNFSKKQISEAHENLNEFIDESFIFISEDEIKLYDSINTLIIESTKDGGIGNIDAIHEAFTLVLDYITTNKKTNLIFENENKLLNLDLSLDNDLTLENIIESALDKFNKKYDNLNENDLKIIKIFSSNNINEKNKIFKSLKEEILEKLSSINKNGIEDKINKTIQKINEMKNDDESLLNNVIELNDLKSNLLI